MTLRAVQPPPHKHPNLFRHYIRRRPNLVVRNEMPRRRPIPLRRQSLPRDFIVGPIGCHILPDPLPILLAELRRQPIRENRHPENIGKSERPIVHELRRPNQRVNHLLPLPRIPQRHKLTHPLRRRQRPRQIQTNPAQKFRVPRYRRWHNLEFPQLRQY